MRRREFIKAFGGRRQRAALPCVRSAARIGWLVFGDAKIGSDRSVVEGRTRTSGIFDGRNIEIVFRMPTQIGSTSGIVADLSHKSLLLLGVGTGAQPSRPS